jgi:hypothetical protein
MADNYQDIPGGFRLWLCRVGKVLENAEGAQVYFQPGDDETAILDTLDALGEVPEDRQAMVALMALEDYFDA